MEPRRQKIPQVHRLRFTFCSLEWKLKSRPCRQLDCKNGVGTMKNKTPKQKPSEFEILLTDKQLEYVNFIGKFWKKMKYGPSEQEIADRFLISTPSAHSMIVRLCALGALIRTEGAPRSVRLPGHSGKPTRPPPGSWVFTGKK